MDRVFNNTADMNYRIKEYKNGFVVEVQKIRWYGKKYWVHLISATGISSMPWYHRSYKSAEANLLIEVGRRTLKNSKP